MKPTARGDRILVLDALRGFALFGIPLVHFPYFGIPDGLAGWPLEGAPTSDVAAWFVVYGLCMTKFVALFSTLFGMGLVLQMQRAEARGEDFGAFYVKRLGWLAVFGLLHGLFLFEGDILLPYAVGGVLLFAVRRWPPRALLGTAGALFGFGALLAFGLTWIPEPAAPTYAEARTMLVEPLPWEPEDALSLVEIAQIDESQWDLIQRKAYQDGPLVTTLLVRGISYMLWLFYATLSSFHWRVLAYFAIGAALMKLGIFELHRRVWLRHAAVWGLAVGLAWSVISFVLHTKGTATRLATVLDEFGSVFLSAGYFGAFALAAQRFASTLPVRGFANAGRMALTNYVGQSLAINLLFLWIGFDLFGRFNRPTLLMLALATFILQMCVSSLWLRRFRMGPLEWLWRRLSYGRL